MTEEQKSGWFSRLKSGLGKTTSRLSDGIVSIFTQEKLDDAALEQLEELLIAADMGVKTSAKVVAEFSKQRFDKGVSTDAVKTALAVTIGTVLKAVAKPLEVDGVNTPYVIVMVGVNGNGKTTTMGKLALQFKGQGKKVMLAAVDTFRAAAVEQLQVWGERAGVPVIKGEPNADPASVAYKALEEAQAQQCDVLMIDTAGRLQNKSNLMQELQKILAVLKKLDASAPHAVVQVLDATTGQNAISQVQAFKEMVQATGLIVTKLDGSARAGVVVALAETFGIPIHAIGVGEGIEDLQPFNADDFAKSLVGL